VKVNVSERKPQVFVITAEGEVDMSTSPDLRSALLSVFKKSPSHVLVDLAGVSYIDSSGIATLVEGLQLSRKGDVRFTLAGASPPVEAVFDLAYLKTVFEMVPSVEGLLGGEPGE
jgi:anti-sigma B factor antagonist